MGPRLRSLLLFQSGLMLTGGFLQGVDLHGILLRFCSCLIWLVWSMSVVRGEESVNLRQPAVLMMGSWLLWCIVSLIWCDSLSLGIESIEHQFQAFSFIFACASLGKSSSFRAQFLHLWLMIIWIAGIYAFYQLWVALPKLREEITLGEGTAGIMFQSRLQSNEPFSFFLYPNLYATFCGMAVLLVINIKGKRFNGWFIWCVTQLFLTGAKGAWLSVVISTVTSRKRVIIIFSLLLLLFLCIYSTLGMDGMPASLRVRLGYWATACAMFIDHPLGVGVGQFSDHYSRYILPYASEVKLAHGMFFEWLAEGGVVLLLFMLCWKRSFVSWFRETDADVIDGHMGFAPELLVLSSFLAFSAMAGVGRFDMSWNQFPGILLFAVIITSPLIPYILCRRVFHLRKGARRSLLCFIFLYAQVDILYADWALFSSLLSAVIILFPSAKVVKKAQRPWLIPATGFVFSFASLWYSVQLFPVDVFRFSQNLSIENVDYLFSIAKNTPGGDRAWTVIFDHVLHHQVAGMTPEQKDRWLDESVDGALKYRPHSAKLWLTKARLQQDPISAESCFQQALQEYPSHPRYALEYAEWLFKQGRTKEAKSMILQAELLNDQSSAYAVWGLEYCLRYLDPAEITRLQILKSVLLL